MDMRNKELIESLTNCMNYCNWCADACLDEDNLKDMIACIRVDKACAATCNALIQVLPTKYDNIQGLVDYCLKVCKACGDECEKYPSDHCKKCAEACRKAEKALQKFSA